MKNKNQHLTTTVLFILWLLASFGLIYFLMTKDLNQWSSSSYTFLRYLIIVQPISMVWVAYLLAKGNLSDLKNKIRPFLAISSVLLVLAFTMIKWTSTTTIYGQYGASDKNSPNELFLLPTNVTPYELETLYREAVKIRYDLALEKIWTFGGIIFFSTFLMLCVIDKGKHQE
jgi:membrane protease YdiL (CAAX protease family)